MLRWVATLVAVCLPYSCDAFPEVLSIRIPNGYRGPIAIVDCPNQHEPEVPSQTRVFEIPSSGIYTIDDDAELPNDYRLEVSYVDGERVLVDEYEEARESEVAYRGGGHGMTHNGGPPFYWAFIGTEQEYAEWDITTWGEKVNEHCRQR